MTTPSSSSRRATRSGSSLGGRAGLLSVLLGLGLACGNGGGGDAGPAFNPTFTNVNQLVFVPSCAISSCHAPPVDGAVGNLDLKTNPYVALLGDGGGVPATDIGEPYNYKYNGMPLVDPGNPENSLLYLKIAEGNSAPTGCVQGQDAGCQYGQHMPNVAGEALSASVIEAVREWIADGAKDD